MKRYLLLTVLLAWSMLSTAAAQESGKAPWEEFEKRIDKSREIGALGPDLFGDSVSLAEGGLSFSATDVDLPGNDGLPVAFARKYTVYNHWKYPDTGSPLADWDLDVPNISGVFAPDWTIGQPYTTSTSGNRCSLAALPTEPPRDYQARDFWHGNTLSIPGVGGGEVLQLAASASRPSSGGPYLWTTADNIRISCLPNIKNGSGEGFLAIAPDGTQYWFDWMAQYAEPGLIMEGRKNIDGFLDQNPVARRKNVLYATKVQDRFGNTVTYTYTNAWNAPAVLTRIAASDGRQIDIAYSSGRVNSVTANGRSWSYAYGTTPAGRRTLTTVTLPDASKWTIGFAPLTDAYMQYRVGSMSEPARSCLWSETPLNVADQPIGTITHPSGAVGSFKIGVVSHGRSNVPVACYNVTTTTGYPLGTGNDTNDDMNQYVIQYDSLSLLQKTLSGPGISTQSWSYGYDPGISFYLTTGATFRYPVCHPWTVADCVTPRCLSDSCALNSRTTVVEPGGKWVRYTYGNSYRYNEGKLLKVERGSDATHILRTDTNAYDLSLVDQAYPATAGDSLRQADEAFASVYTRPLLQRQTSQQGATFTWQVATGCASGSYCFDSYARPVKVIKTSSLGHSKTEITAYSDTLSKWVLGQVKSVTCVAPVACTPSWAPAGIVESQVDYDPVTALPTANYSFGKLLNSLYYYADGTLNQVKDGNNNVTTLSNWKRGIPQAIAYPATPDQPTGATESAVVDNNGWITSTTDENSDKTCYGYDTVGRIASITYPSESAANTCNTSTWAATTQTFQKIASTEYGIPANHWKQVVSTGNGRKAVYFDAFWRPLVEESYDNADPGNTRSVIVKRYDDAGRLAFRSYPMRTLGSYATVTTGSSTSYDALDRAVQASVPSSDSTTGTFTTTTEYLPGFLTRVTNARGQQATTSYMAYDQPTTNWPMSIAQPEGAYTDIVRDVFGKSTSITRRNADGSLQQSRFYVYNAYGELCKTIEPETGITSMGYDPAGNLAWSAAGYSSTIPSSLCFDPSWVGARRVDRSYDARNRVKSLVFPDHLGDTTYSYTPDNLLASITADNGGSDQVTTQYTYNRRRLMTQERMLWNSINWPISYAFDGNGHLASQTSPSGTVVTYAPNALGQPTKAGSYATGVSYYPNGGIAQFTYGNGIVHSMTQNDRQLPERSRDVYGSTVTIDDSYDYDGNGNVAAISDALPTHRGDRTMSYDGLDRLTATTSPMYGTGASYTYDVLDNLTRVKTGGTATRDQFYCYDPATWRLTNVKTTSCSGSTVIGLGYDVQGNLANKNGVTYAFDFGNRLRRVSSTGPGGQVSTYVYDGHGRRVRDWTGASKYSQYSSDGRIVHDHDYRTNKWHDYIQLGGSLVAILEYDSTAGVYLTKYQHTDALGSPVAVTDQARTVLERSEFEPYGKLLNRPLTDGPGYTGHVSDAATGLSYMQQRYYDPGIGRFLSVDPVDADGSTGANFNRYKYASNNPYRYMDPDGRYEEDVHRELTEVLAQAAGAPRTIAGAIAGGDQGVDDNPATSPMGMSPMGEAVQVRADYHFTTSERREALYQEFKNSGKPEDLGKYLHAHQDSYSHAGFGPRFGHLRAGHAPDKTFNDVGKADRMARTTYNTIINSRGSIEVNGQSAAWGQIVPWSRISSAVHDFNSATTAAEKAAALSEIRRVIP